MIIPLLILSLSSQYAESVLPPARASAENLAVARAMENPESASTVTEGGITKISGKSNKDVCIQGSQTLILENIGACFLESEGGLGFMAHGQGEYPTKSKNPDQIRVSRRAAYQKAYLRALEEAVNFVGTVSVERLVLLASSNESQVTETSTLLKSEELSAEEIKTIASALLKGVTLWDISDNGEGIVNVTVCLHPKVFGTVTGPSFLRQGSDFNSAIDEVFAEILKGVVAPNGGRTVLGPGGQMCWIAFGSDVILKDATAGMRRMAQKKASIRAQANLVAMLQGQQVSALTKIFDSSISTESNFKVSQDANGKVKAQLQQMTAIASSVSTVETEITAITKGVLPPGVTMRHFTNEELGWVYSIVLYAPDLSDEAKALVKRMASTDPMGPASSNTTNAPNSSGNQDYDPSKPGPGGKVGG
jgi:hypothetical protein